MYNSVFLSSFGSSIYTTLGAVNRINRILKKTVIWNSVGNSSIIVFLKCLGYSFNDMITIFDNFELLVSTFNYSSLLIEDENYKKKYIKTWLVECMGESSYLDQDSTLEDVYTKTGFFPCFIVWNSELKIIENLNPKTHSKLKLVDCVLCCLCGIGTYKHYTIENNTYKNVFAIDPVPYEHVFKIEEKKLNYLYIINKNQLNNADISSLGPLVDIENSLLEEYFDRFNSKHLEHKENTLVLYSKLVRVHLIDELHNLYEFGNRMCETFLEGRSTFERYQDELKNIEEQE